LTLHHRNYERLGREIESDVELLCATCHEKADSERKKRTENRRSNTRFYSGMTTYAEKKYGDSDYWPEDIEEEFSDWLERTNYYQ
jgi:hypothetical protein